ncbi:hypothetical protein HK104_006076, partial [Borealophlyctis nickersoniae]
MGSTYSATHAAITSHVIPAIQGLQKDVSKKMDVLKGEGKKRKKEVKGEGDRLKTLESKLRTAVEGIRNGTMGAKAGDPYVYNLGEFLDVRLSVNSRLLINIILTPRAIHKFTAIKHHLASTHRHALTRTASLSDTLFHFAHWESTLINTLRAALLAYTTIPTATHGGGIDDLTHTIQSIDADKEWRAFIDANRDELGSIPTTTSRSITTTSRSTTAASANSTRRSTSSHHHPDYTTNLHASDPLVTPLHAGPVQKQTKLFKKWTERWVILTPAGWLHEYVSQPKDDVGTVGDGEFEGPKQSVWLKE